MRFNPASALTTPTISTAVAAAFVKSFPTAAFAPCLGRLQPHRRSRGRRRKLGLLLNARALSRGNRRL